MNIDKRWSVYDRLKVEEAIRYELAEIFVQAVPAMKHFMAKTLAPFMAKVHKNASVKAWK